MTAVISAQNEAAVRRSLTLVFITLLLDVMGIAIISPVLPSLLQELTGDSISNAAIDGGWLLLSYSVMQFIFAPIIGNLSDRFGRRPILLISILTFALDNLICALAVSYSMLFIGRVLAGVSGASFSTCSAYIADISNDQNRARNFGLIGIAFGLGFIFGPLIGGLLGEFGSRIPFYGAAALSFINVIVAWFLLPETLPPEQRRKFEWKRANPFGALKQIWHYDNAVWLCLVFFLYWMAHAIWPTVWSFITTYRYGWSEGQIGLSLALAGVCQMVMMGLVMPRLIRRIGEWRTALFGLCFSVIGFAGYALSSQGWIVLIVMVVTSFEYLADAPLRSIAAAKIPASAQGEFQGALTSIGSITMIIGPLLFPPIFQRFSEPQTPTLLVGAPFMAAGLFLLLALILFLWKIKPAKSNSVD
jgi:DHA1 family tetracycline resistance protein-like MFS transporter